MSGKTTLLRTVGINAVLAFAGAPVRATQLRISPLAIGATIRVHDSLSSGTSRFFGELQRLRRIVNVGNHGQHVLFLLDELLHGTNSHDRVVGAVTIIRDLVDRNGIGLMTTHDLALTGIADALAPRAANVHLRDTIKDGTMTFDYRVYPGVVTKSNALALMMSLGFEIDLERVGEIRLKCDQASRSLTPVDGDR